DMEAGAGIAGAGPARHHAQARPPSELAEGVGHHRRATFLAAGHETDRIGVVERIEHGEVALARHGEYRVGAVDLELIDQDLRTGPAARGSAHARYLRGCHWPPEVLEFGAVGNPPSREGYSAGRGATLTRRGRCRSPPPQRISQPMISSVAA